MVKSEPDSYPGNFDCTNGPLKFLEAELDISDEKEGNILGKGSITGLVVYGEKVE